MFAKGPIKHRVICGVAYLTGVILTVSKELGISLNTGHIQSDKEVV